MSHLFRPCPWPRPWLRIRFHRIRAPLEQRFCHFRAAPAARPAERCALENLVPHAGSCSGIEQRPRERPRFLAGHVVAHGRHFMQYRSTEASHHVGIAALQNQTEARQIRSAIQIVISRI
jgi:hypothetical protein